uniref:Secreted protein n=1 Tax=Panagrellus redivivus TaxID=6233 RepID=A0A7E4VJQ3_PANRE
MLFLVLVTSDVPKSDDDSSVQSAYRTLKPHVSDAFSNDAIREFLPGCSFLLPFRKASERPRPVVLVSDHRQDGAHKSRQSAGATSVSTEKL